MNTYRTSYALGWFSIGLGVTEILANQTLSGYLGMEDKAKLVRAFGFREVAAGIGILSQRNLAPWLWARVGGDALDIAALATGLTAKNPKRQRAGAALAIVGAITVLDILCAKDLSERGS